MALTKKKITGAIFFDLEKAFDKASHAGIIARLETLGLPPTLLNWMVCFRKDRNFQVTYKNSLSNQYPISCRVPQGSCLSPTLFIIFFSHIAKHIPSNIKIALYADDLCIWITCKSIKDLEFFLQIAIDKIVEFCKTWGFSINRGKTCYTTFTTAGLRSNYAIKYK